MAQFLARLLEVEVAAGFFPSRYDEGGPSARPGARHVGAAPGRGPTEVARGLRVPWGLAPLPTAARWSASATARWSSGCSRTAASRRSGRCPASCPAARAGCSGLALSPTFAEDALVYAYLTAGSDNRVVRFSVAGDRSAPRRPSSPASPRRSIHNGGRIAFGPDGTLYVGTGDAGDAGRAQNRSSSGGKVLRVARTARCPADNPFPGSPFFSLGHRNVQGLAFDEAGRL